MNKLIATKGPTGMASTTTKGRAHVLEVVLHFTSELTILPSNSDTMSESSRQIVCSG